MFNTSCFAFLFAFLHFCIFGSLHCLHLSVTDLFVVCFVIVIFRSLVFVYSYSPTDEHSIKTTYYIYWKTRGAATPAHPCVYIYIYIYMASGANLSTLRRRRASPCSQRSSQGPINAAKKGEERDV